VNIRLRRLGAPDASPIPGFPATWPFHPADIMSGRCRQTERGTPDAGGLTIVARSSGRPDDAPV